MKRSLRSAVVFGVGNGLTPGIGFLLLPLYTRALTPSQYGPLSVLLAVSSAAAMLFTFGLDLGLFLPVVLRSRRRYRFRQEKVPQFCMAIPDRRPVGRCQSS